jgi:hypothetical protein
MSPLLYIQHFTHSQLIWNLTVTFENPTMCVCVFSTALLLFNYFYYFSYDFFLSSSLVAKNLFRS